MEVKATLNKPCTTEQRNNFIITNNYYNGYEIREDDNKIEAWGFTQAEKEEQERQRVGNLTCTKRVFILMLEQLQYNYFDTILPIIEANRQAKLEWELCVELKRSNELIDTLAAQLGITSTDLDNLFKYANGEITLEEFTGGNDGE